MKTCLWCHVEKSISDFYKCKSSPDGLLARCKLCETKRTTAWALSKLNYRRDYSKKRREQNPEYSRRKSNEHATKVRNIVRKAFGNKCACCGETEPLFLSIDHVKNDGNIDRNTNGRRVCGGMLYRRIINEGFPKDKYQLLCMNCNFGKSKNYGVCPHTEKI